MTKLDRGFNYLFAQILHKIATTNVNFITKVHIAALFYAQTTDSMVISVIYNPFVPEFTLVSNVNIP